MADPAHIQRIAVTSNEPLAEKHLVEPYAAQPLVQQRAGQRTCVFCGNSGFRRSRLRITDVLRLLLLRYPVRCIRCGQRQYAFIRTALSARPPRRQLGL